MRQHLLFNDRAVLEMLPGLNWDLLDQHLTGTLASSNSTGINHALATAPLIAAA